MLYQVGAIAAFAKAKGSELTHVKPHGALYNMAAVDYKVARAIAKTVAAFSRELILVGLATSPLLLEEGARVGLRVAAEAFADRAYNKDGTLVSRKRLDSLLTNPSQAAVQGLRVAQFGEVVTVDGTVLKVKADTLCVHSDGATALEIAQAIRSTFTEAGVELCPFTS